MRQYTVSPEAIDGFFGNLVGDEAARQRLHGELTESLSDPQHVNEPVYQRLALGASNAIRQHASDAGLSPYECHDMASNGSIGTRMAVNALAAVGNTYRVRAQVPQRPEVVTGSTDAILRHVFGMAFAGADTATLNRMCFEQGFDPNGSFRDRKKMRQQTGLRINPRSFVTEVDDAGQVAIRPRFSNSSNNEDRRCPATGAVITTAEGRPRSGLFTFIQTIGAVARTEIYPHLFQITP